MSQQFVVTVIDWPSRVAGLSIEMNSSRVDWFAPFSAIVFPKGWTCGEPEIGLVVHLSWEFERGYARGRFPGRCKASRTQGVKTPGRREMRLLCEGELVEHNSGSQRYERRQKKATRGELARIEQGLLWHRRRYCRAQDYQGRVEVPA